MTYHFCATAMKTSSYPKLGQISLSNLNSCWFDGIFAALIFIHYVEGKDSVKRMKCIWTGKHLSLCHCSQKNAFSSTDSRFHELFLIYILIKSTWSISAKSLLPLDTQYRNNHELSHCVSGTYCRCIPNSVAVLHCNYT